MQKNEGRMTTDAISPLSLFPPSVCEWLEKYKTSRSREGLGGKYQQREDGVWVDQEGHILRDQQPMTLSNLYNFRISSHIEAKVVQVPASLIDVERELGWIALLGLPVVSDMRGECVIDLDTGRRVPTHESSDVIEVPLIQWDAMDALLGPIGVWSPDIPH